VHGCRVPEHFGLHAPSPTSRASRGPTASALAPTPTSTATASAFLVSHRPCIRQLQLVQGKCRSVLKYLLWQQLYSGVLASGISGIAVISNALSVRVPFSSEHRRIVCTRHAGNLDNSEFLDPHDNARAFVGSVPLKWNSTCEPLTCEAWCALGRALHV